jgi:hyperosmotically inducible protein
VCNCLSGLEYFRGTHIDDHLIAAPLRRQNGGCSNSSEVIMKTNLLAAVLGVAISLGTVGTALALDNDTDGVAQDKSAQPGTDTWITTKVKTELMSTKGIPSTDISVTTTNGLVTLSGVVDNKAQLQKSVAIAKAIKGVHGVDSSALSARN